MLFDKSAVDVAELCDAECRRVLKLAGFCDEPTAITKLTNGGCAANYAVTFSDGARVVLKACVGPTAEDLGAEQLRVLRSIAEAGGARAAPAPAYGPGQEPRTVACAAADGAVACAIVMELLPGVAMNVALRGGGDAPAAFRALGGALARVHAVPPPAGLYEVATPGYVERYVRCAAPLEAAAEAWREFDGKAFVPWALQHVGAARAALVDAGLPRGLCHGDPYADNVLLDGDEATLVDWEDCCVGPFVFDLACAAVGGCLRGAVLDENLLEALLASYARDRAFSAAEAMQLAPLMRANAVTTAVYRWHAFHVTAPDAPPAAKQAHVEMVDAADALGGATGAVVARIALAAAAASLAARGP
ncbi:kinase-like domain-containing protein [Pelagophyceae sp. CCMP2097]|nr:kinase-like domain-containing protein [Pelagophyceae sp. CCMP2097]